MSDFARRTLPYPRVLGFTLLIVLVAAAYCGATSSVRKIPSFDSPFGDAWTDNTFRRFAYVASPDEVPAELEALGSRVEGRDDFTGTLRSAWFVARPRVALFVAGYPRAPKNKLFIESRNAFGELTPLTFDRVNPREAWRPWIVALPPGALVFRIVAVDGEQTADAWIGVSEPSVPSWRPALLDQTSRAFLAFAINLLLYAGAGVALWSGLACYLPQRRTFPALLPLLGGASVALAGFVAFWLFFWHPVVGRVFSWTLAVLGACALLEARPATRIALRHARDPLLLAAFIGLLYLAMLTLYDPPRLSFAAAHRFDEGLPSDNEIPRAFVERLAHGESPRQLWGDWLSSDRPPLQTGWALLSWPVLHALGLDLDTATATAGSCFQLLWVLAVWTLARHLGIPRRAAAALVVAVAFNGVMLQYTVFVWPKLGAAALMVAAWLCWCEARRPAHIAAGGICAALGWLAHGGVAFSLLGLVPLALLWRKRLPLRRWVPALIAFAICAAPWVAYQRLYEPPGNRLLKWHLAGSPAIDDRGVLVTLRDRYREVGLSGALQARWANLRLQVAGRWPDGPTLAGDRPGHARRADETTFLLRSFAVWSLALLVPILWIFRRPALPAAVRHHLPAATGWLFAGLATWLALMFLPNAATIHQGTLVTQLLAFTLLAACAWHQSPRLFTLLATLQGTWFFYAWLPPGAGVEGAAIPGPGMIATGIAIALFSLLWLTAGGEPPRRSPQRT